MKKLIMLVLALVLTAGVFSQQRWKTDNPYTIALDTVQGNENVYFETGLIPTEEWQTVTIQALFTQVGSTSGGTAMIQGSVDGTSYATLIDATGLFKGMPNDSVTITSGGVGTWVIEKNPYNYYRVFVDGDASDTSIVTVKYILKK